MAWTTFPTLTDGQVLTGAHMQIIRDNFAETAPGKATTAGSYFVSVGANSVAERVTASAAVGTTESSAITSYGNLGTVGPSSGALTTGARALVVVGCAMTTDTVGSRVYMGYAVSGATTVAATDATAMGYDTNAVGKLVQCSRVIMQGLTNGSNSFVSQYRVTSGNGSWAQRNLIVIPY